jgi:hypothetical protein
MTVAEAFDFWLEAIKSGINVAYDDDTPPF